MKVLFGFLFIVSAFIGLAFTDLNLYFIPKGILTPKKKAELIEHLESKYLKLSEQQRIDYKFNFILSIARKDGKHEKMWQSRIENISNCLADYYKIDVKKEIKLEVFARYHNGDAEGIYVYPLLVNRN